MVTALVVPLLVLKTFRCTNRPFGGDDGPGDDYDEDEDESDDDDDDDDDDEDEEEEEPPVPAARAKRAARGPLAAVAVDPDPYATTLKTREADKVVAPTFPSLTQLTHYSVKLAQNLIAASCLKDCAEIPWLNEAASKTFLELANSGAKRFESLDVKFARL